MKKITLLRYHQSDRETLGMLKIGDFIPPLYTLELPWVNNLRNISCIPVGEYHVSTLETQKYKDVYHIKDVPNRNYILFHPGNFITQTKGCILIGLGTMTSPNSTVIRNSVHGIQKLRKYLSDRDFTLIIEEGF